MSGGVQIRLARPDDFAALATFLWEREFDIPGGSFHGHDSVESIDLAELFARERTVQAVIAVCDGAIVGSFEIRELTPELLWICSLYVAPEHRRYGLGTRLAHAMMRLLVERPQSSHLRARASYNPANRSALKMYNALGAVEPEPGGIEILTPALMRIPPFARFTDRHRLTDSAKTFAAAVSLQVPGVRIVAPGLEERGRVERYEWNGRSVYPQRVAVGDDWVDVVFVAGSLLPAMIAVPSWSIEILPSTDADATLGNALLLRVVNRGPTPIAFSLPAGGLDTTVQPSEAIEADITARSPTGEPSGPLSLVTRIEGDEIKFDCSPIPSSEPIARASEGLTSAAPSFFSFGDTTAVIEPALGGCVSRLCTNGRRLLRTAESTGRQSLGWIYPWRGGLFTLVDSAGPDVFRLPPWGLCPGWIGFNTALVGMRAENPWVEREGIRGTLRERTRFEARADGLDVEALVENQSAADTQASCAVFAFLDSAFVSRRSFETATRDGVVIQTPTGAVQVSVDAGATAHAFNLGDDGVHLAVVASAVLRGGHTLAVRARLQFAARRSDE